MTLSKAQKRTKVEAFIDAVRTVEADIADHMGNLSSEDAQKIAQALDHLAQAAWKQKVVARNAGE